MSDFYDYAVHWGVDKPSSLWQLTGSHSLRVDITKRFDAKYRITALRELPESESNALKKLMEKGIIPSIKCGQLGYKGDCEEIFKHVSRPGNGWGWYVTNNVLESPGWRHAGSKNPNMLAGQSFQDYMVTHPKDGYTVQFHNVPWEIFNRYWRKPVNLDKQFHTSKRKNRFGKNYGYTLGFPAVHVLYFNSGLTSRFKCIIADFARMGDPGDTVNKKLHEWMTKYARQFRVLTDQVSPFVKDEAEVYFTMEWM